MDRCPVGCCDNDDDDYDYDGDGDSVLFNSVFQCAATTAEWSITDTAQEKNITEIDTCNNNNK
jgi:hypothetical protein